MRSVDDKGYNVTVYPGVYPQSEDTYLLIDALDVNSEDIFLEVGCGAGLVTMSVAKKAYRVVSVDHSFDAVRNTLENLIRNDLYDGCHVIESDLLGAFSPSFKFSLIVFNPPYLPEDDERTDLDHALIGGTKGTEMTQRFIRQAVEHLVKGGRIFTVVSNLTDIDSIKLTMKECGLTVEVASESCLFFEKIQVLKGTL